VITTSVFFRPSFAARTVRALDPVPRPVPRLASLADGVCVPSDHHDSHGDGRLDGDAADDDGDADDDDDGRRTQGARARRDAMDAARARSRICDDG